MITVTGMESSGTKAMGNLVAEMTTEEVRHISWPNQGLRWGPDYVEGQKVIIVVRRPDIRNQSAVKSGYVKDIDTANKQWYDGIKTMAGIPDALWISYEAMVGNQTMQVANIARYLGVPVPTVHLLWLDASDKYK